MKKIYKYGDIISIEELEEVAKRVVLKALKVIENVGNKHATNILEGKDVDTFEDLQQEVMLKIIENDYVLTKECYKKVNKVLNDRKKDVVKLTFIEDNQENISELDKKAYIEYINADYNEKRRTDVLYYKTIINGLTKRQKEIFAMYEKLQNLHEVARVLGIDYQTVKTTIYRIRQKLVYMV